MNVRPHRKFKLCEKVDSKSKFLINLSIRNCFSDSFTIYNFLEDFQNIWKYLINSLFIKGDKLKEYVLKVICMSISRKRWNRCIFSFYQYILCFYLLSCRFCRPHPPMWVGTPCFHDRRHNLNMTTHII